MDTKRMVAERQKAYLESELLSDMQPGRGVQEAFTQIPRLVLGRGPLNADLLHAALDLIHARRDCADFALSGLLRILYRFGSSPLLTQAMRVEIEQAVQGFCYWYDQPGVRGMCFHTENHQILFHSCEVLAGQLFPNLTFANAQQTGAWHSAHGAALARQWFDQRARFGWTGPLTVAGQEIELHGYPRFDNPYCQAEPGQRRYTIRHGDDELLLEF